MEFFTLFGILTAGSMMFWGFWVLFLLSLCFLVGFTETEHWGWSSGLIFVALVALSYTGIFNAYQFTVQHPMKVTTAKLYAGIFSQNFIQELDPAKSYYLYVVTGSVTINGHALNFQDAVDLNGESQLSLTSANCEILFFEL